LLFAGKSKDRSKTLIFAVVPIVAIILGLVFLFIYLKRRRKKKTLKENAENEFESTDSLHFDFETIRVATDDFSLTNKIGEGGFGVVYKVNSSYYTLFYPNLNLQINFTHCDSISLS
jgi:hypothetical protein